MARRLGVIRKRKSFTVTRELRSLEPLNPKTVHSTITGELDQTGLIVLDPVSVGSERAMERTDGRSR